jgi:hypothetical protein
MSPAFSFVAPGAASGVPTKTTIRTGGVKPPLAKYGDELAETFTAQE